MISSGAAVSVMRVKPRRSLNQSTALDPLGDAPGDAARRAPAARRRGRDRSRPASRRCAPATRISWRARGTARARRAPRPAPSEKPPARPSSRTSRRSPSRRSPRPPRSGGSARRSRSDPRRAGPRGSGSPRRSPAARLRRSRSSPDCDEVVEGAAPPVLGRLAALAGAPVFEDGLLLGLSRRQRKTRPSWTGCRVSMSTVARATGRPSATSDSQKPRRRSGSRTPARPASVMARATIAARV